MHFGKWHKYSIHVIMILIVVHRVLNQDTNQGELESTSAGIWT